MYRVTAYNAAGEMLYLVPDTDAVMHKTVATVGEAFDLMESVKSAHRWDSERHYDRGNGFIRNRVAYFRIMQETGHEEFWTRAQVEEYATVRAERRASRQVQDLAEVQEPDMSAASEIRITPAMVREIEGATHFVHGYEVGGHLATLRAMASRGLVKLHDGGGTLTDRGVWLRGYLMANGPHRSFTPAEMDADDVEMGAGNESLDKAPRGRDEMTWTAETVRSGVALEAASDDFGVMGVPGTWYRVRQGSKVALTTRNRGDALRLFQRRVRLVSGS